MLPMAMISMKRTVDAIGMDFYSNFQFVPVKALKKDPIPISKPGQHVCGQLVHPPR